MREARQNIEQLSILVGRYFAVKYRGNNGDLIVGKVIDVDSRGLVYLTNLLNGKQSVKRHQVLLRRCRMVSRKTASNIRDVFNESGDKQAARGRGSAESWF